MTSTNLILEHGQSYVRSSMKLCESMGGGNRRWERRQLDRHCKEGACVCGFLNEADAKKAGAAAQAEVNGCCVRLGTSSPWIIRLPGCTAVISPFDPSPFRLTFINQTGVLRASFL